MSSLNEEQKAKEIFLSEIKRFDTSTLKVLV